MPNANDRTTFRVVVMHDQQPQPDPQLVQLSIASFTGNRSSRYVKLLNRHWMPELAPSEQLLNLYCAGRFDWHELCRRFSLELENRENACERLRALACDPGLAIVARHDSCEHDVARALQRHLSGLECERRWREGWMIGGYLTPILPQIEKLGGIWFARHKAWVMPNRTAWNRIHSLLPVDF